MFARSSRRAQRWLILAIVSGAVLLVAGCLRYTAELTLSSDDHVSGTLIIAKKPPDGSDSATAQPTGPAAELTVPEPQSTSPDIRVEPFSHNGQAGYKITFDSASFSDMAAFTPVSSRGGTITFTRDGDLVQINMSIDLTYADNSANDALTKDFQGEVSLAVPGEVVETNGEHDGDLIVWKLTPLAVNSISATVDYPKTATEAEQSSAGVPVSIWVIAGVVLVVGVIALVLRTRRRPRHAAKHRAAPTPRPPRTRTTPRPAADVRRPADAPPDAHPIQRATATSAGDMQDISAVASSRPNPHPAPGGWPPPRPHWRN